MISDPREPENQNRRMNANRLCQARSSEISKGGQFASILVITDTIKQMDIFASTPLVPAPDLHVCKQL
jgi:hypothetical protein